MVVTLIGYRGCGKSTVGRLVAQSCGWTYVDADEEIERAAGKTIREIFAESGEPAFREIEESVIERLLERDALVLAAGGGAVLREATRHRMKAAGPVVWLAAGPETLQARIEGDSTTDERRPNLTARGGLEEIRTLLERRNPLYEQTADIRIDTENLSPDEVADQILAELRRNEEFAL